LAKEIDPESSTAALFGSRVRRLRTAAGLTQAELGEKTHVVASRITQVERASGAKPTLELARALDEVLRGDGLLVDLWPYVYREAFPDWSRSFIAYSERAVSIRQYAAYLVPGLLQTEDYARGVLRTAPGAGSAEDIDRQVALRVERQAIVLLRALRCIYVALGAFVSATLVTLLGAVAEETPNVRSCCRALRAWSVRG